MADVVWAPWRMAYILGDKPTGCIFCEKICAQDDVQNLILWRGHTAFVMLNRYPYNNGHLMVVVSEVRVIPQHLDNTYALLLPYFQALRQEANPA